MSVDIHACWKGPLATTREELKEALEALGFPATVLHDLEGADGYWPVDIGGCKTGVVIYFDDNLEELAGDYPVLAAALEGRDSVVQFSWGGDSAEAGTGLALAAAIGKLRDAIIYDPQGEECLSVDEAVAQAKEMFEAALKEGYQEREDE